MAQRYCTNCGAELRQDDSICGNCGRPVHEVAAVPTPEADVESPLHTQVSNPEQAPSSAGRTGKVSEADSKRYALIALGVIAVVIALSIVAATLGGNATIVLLGVAGFVTVALVNWHRDRVEREGGGLVPRSGFEEPVSEAERTRELEEEIARYMHDGFSVRQRTPTTAQLVRPKKFSFAWAFVWLLLSGVGIVIYLIYYFSYAAKQEEGRYIEVDEYGAVKITRQI